MGLLLESEVTHQSAAVIRAATASYLVRRRMSVLGTALDLFMEPWSAGEV
jgi:hypothetical protein